MADTCSVYIRVAQKDLDDFFHLLGEAGFGNPEETESKDGYTELAFHEMKYAGENEFDKLVKLENCPPFAGYWTTGHNYPPMDFIFHEGKWYEHLIDVGGKKVIHLDYTYDDLAELYLQLEIEQVFDNYCALIGAILQ